MIVYNVTIKVSQGIEASWLQWQKEEHIPEIMQTGLFTSYKMFHLLDQDDSEGCTYVVQYFAATLEDYNKYIEEFADALRKKAHDKWGNQFVGFRSVMRVVS